MILITVITDSIKSAHGNYGSYNSIHFQTIAKLEDHLQTAFKTHIEKVRTLIEKKLASFSSSIFNVKFEILQELNWLAESLVETPTPHLKELKTVVEKLFIVQHVHNSKIELLEVAERLVSLEQRLDTSLCPSLTV